MTLSTPLYKSATDLLRELGLFERVNGVAKLDDKTMEAFRQRTFAFGWVNMATTHLPISKLYTILQTTPHLAAPRTAHLGNWDDIIRGRIGKNNANTVICAEKGLGYPLLYEFTQTEDTALKQGDMIYVPGSLIEGGQREVLQLFTWDGTQYVERSREKPYFMPFVLTPVEGELVPLTSVHRQRCLRHSNVPFHFASATIYPQQKLVKEILHVLIEEATRKPDPTQGLLRIIDRCATLDGDLTRGNIRVADKGYHIGEMFYQTTDELVEAVMLPYQAAADPTSFFAQMGSMPHTMPVLSKTLVPLLYSILNTHYPNCTVERDLMTRPCNPHFEWGANGMAGYWPKKFGWFPREARYARNIHQTIIKHFPEIDPIFFALLPSSIFLLWPNSAYPEDVEPVNQLIQEVHEQTDALLQQDTQNLLQKVDQIVERWTDRSGQSLSPYYVKRFSGKPSRPVPAALPEESRSLEPAGFADLTIQQASLIVGALYECLARQ